MVPGFNNASVLREQNQNNVTINSLPRRSTKSPDWNPVDIVFAIVGAIGLVGTIVGAIGLAAQEHRDPQLLRRRSDSTTALITDDAITSGPFNEPSSTIQIGKVPFEDAKHLHGDSKRSGEV